MTTEVLTVDTEREAERKRALMRAIGIDKLPQEQRELALNIASRYGLDLLMKHLVMIEGRPYITRDGLLHIAHRSGELDGIVTTEPVLVQPEGKLRAFWRATCSVFRKDMSHPFTYVGRYPSEGGNQRYGPEMATKVAEVAALRRAFDVSLPTEEERWDSHDDEPVATAHEKVKAARARMERATVEEDAEVAVVVDESCGAVFDGEVNDPCTLPSGHDGPHKGAEAVWPA